MAKAAAKKDEFKPLTGADVAAWFEEYMEGKQRPRPQQNQTSRRAINYIGGGLSFGGLPH